MKKLMSTDIILLQENNNYEITLEKAIDLYLKNSEVRYDEKLYQFIFENLSIDEIFELNNIIISNYINDVKKVLDKECNEECLNYIYNEYNRIKYLFTNSKEILMSLYNLNLSIINKYGHSTLCFININNREQMGNVCYSYLPILNMKGSGIILFYSRTSSIYEYALLKTNRCAYFGLLANAYYLNDFELINNIFEMILKPHFNDYYKCDINVQTLINRVLNENKEKDFLYSIIGLFIKDYRLDYKL